MKFLFIGLSIFSGIALISAVSAETQEIGASHITLNGGKRGKVGFPHHQHIDTLGDCNVCHDLYPLSPGAIDDLKAQGKLKKKQVMNKQCIKCHRAEKKTGNKAGPTTCSKCHIR